MKTNFAKGILALGGLLSLSVWAGPISYEGGWMLSTENQKDSIDWQVSYSFKHWLSIGPQYVYQRMVGSSLEYGLVRANYLVKRWNKTDSQGNIYLFGGAGGAKRASDKSAAWMGGLDADWESRRIYTAFRAQFLDSKDFPAEPAYQARIGMAPYLTKFENLHAWVILQTQYFPEATREKLVVTPLMRFYIDNVLWELGVSARGTWTFNTMIHF
jgi:hypothetical protein